MHKFSPKNKHGVVAGKVESGVANRGRERYDPLKKERKVFRKTSGEYENDELGEKMSGYSIYIFNLAPECANNDLWRLFSPFGSIKGVTVMRDSESAQNKGYAFVTMKNHDEASQAIEILNGQSLHGRPLKISFKGKKQTDENSLGDVGAYPLYVYNLGPECEEDSLWKLFTQFGAVKNISIVKNNNTKEAKGYGFVTMRTVEDATNAIKTLNGFILDGRQLNVSFKNRKNEDRGSDESDVKIGEYHIYVNNLAPDAEDSVLWKLFAQFGAIKDVNIVKDSKTHKCLGYGFVTMKNIDDATLAINTLNNSKLDDKVIHVSFKTKKVAKEQD